MLTHQLDYIYLGVKYLIETYSNNTNTIAILRIGPDWTLRLSRYCHSVDTTGIIPTSFLGHRSTDAVIFMTTYTTTILIVKCRGCGDGVTQHRQCTGVQLLSIPCARRYGTVCC